MLHSFAQQSNWVVSVEISADGETVVSGGREGLVILWNADDGTSKLRFEKHKSGVHAVHFAENDTRILSGGEDRQLYLWEADDGSVVRVYMGVHDVNRGGQRPGETALQAVSTSGLRAVSGHKSGVVFR